jgi:dipeptidyl aminopeptidase/acylaminoacyl peptidase
MPIVESNSIELSFASGNSKIAAKLIVPRLRERPTNSPVVVLVTGDGPQGSHSENWRTTIDQFVTDGLPVFVFDFPGLGGSDGDPSRLTLSGAIQNLRDAVEVVKKQTWVDAKRLGVLGSSFGGAVALAVQGNHDCFAAMGLNAPASFLPEAYENEHGPDGMAIWRRQGCSHLTNYGYAAYLDSLLHNLYASARNIHCPTLVVHGDADRIVPISQSHRLVRALGDRARLIELPNVGHGFKEPGSQLAAAQHQVAFFLSSLNPAASQTSIASNP